MKRSAHDCTTTPAMRRLRTRRSQRGEVYFETLVTVPVVFDTTTANVEPLSEVVVAGVV